MMIITCVYIWLIFIQTHEVIKAKETLNVCVLLEETQFRYSKYYAFFTDIIEHVFGMIDNRKDLLEDYSLKLISKDTQVTSLFFVVFF